MIILHAIRNPVHPTRNNPFRLETKEIPVFSNNPVTKKNTDAKITDVTIDNLLSFVRNGKAIITRMKGRQQLANPLRVHPHFDNVIREGYSANHRAWREVGRNPQKRPNTTLAHWFLCDKDSYLLGEGQAYPPEYYNEVIGQNKKGQLVKKEEGY